MATEVFANQPTTTVTSGGTDAPSSGTQETWTVASSSAFAAASNAASPPTQFHVADPATGYTTELIAVTNISGATWTVTRGAESSVPVAHVAGFTITQVVSAGVLGSFVQSPQIYSGMFGDGTDGAATLDGTATVAWGSRSGSTYTMSRDAHLTSLTINPGVTLIQAYRVFCQGTVTNGGTIGVTNSGTNAGAAGSATGSGAYGGGRAGGAGSTTVGAAGGAPGNNGGGGNGGAGGLGSSGAGGLGATGVAILPNWWHVPYPALTGVFQSFNTQIPMSGGFGGGGGGGDDSVSGGGGGAGGPILIYYAWNFVNTGTLNAAGGNGGSPASGNAGGGGSGGGGAIILYTLTPWTNTGTTNVAAGTPGTGHGTGANGSAGTAGTFANIIIM